MKVIYSFSQSVQIQKTKDERQRFAPPLIFSFLFWYNLKQFTIKRTTINPLKTLQRF